MRQDNRSPVTLMTMGIAGFFLAGFFLLVIFGAQVYQEIVGGQAQNNHTRELMGYLITCAKANDSEGSVMILEREEGPVRTGTPAMPFAYTDMRALWWKTTGLWSQIRIREWPWSLERRRFSR